MKIIVAVFLYTLLTVAVKARPTREEEQEAFKSIAAECVKTTGATEADIGVMMKSLPAQNRETKCLRACIMKKINIINADGKLDKPVALQFVAAHTHGDQNKMQIAEEVTGACENIAVPDDHCEAAELYKMCISGGARKFGVDVME